MPNKKTRRSCEICGIKESHLESPLFFANFPLVENRCKKCVQVTGKEDLLYLPIEKLNTIKHICGKHFKNKHMNKKGNKLKKCAVPSLNLMQSPLSDAQMLQFPLHMFKNPQVSEPENIVPSSSKACQGHKPTSHSRNEAVAFVSTVSVPDNIVSSTSKAGQGNEPTSHSRNEAVASVSTVSVPDNIVPSTSKAGQGHEPTSHSRNEAVASVSTELPEMIQVRAKGVKRRIIENEEESLTPRKKKLVERLARTKCTLNSLRKSAVIFDKIQSPVLKELIMNACKNETRKPQAKRWTMNHKLSCLAILKRSAKSYRYLSTALSLPSVKTLNNILKKIPMQTGISQHVLNHLKAMSETRDEKDKFCCLVFDEMTIKSRLIYNEGNYEVEGYEDLGEFGRTSELADHVLVLMLQGMRLKFKQPIAYYFTKATISSAKLAMIIKKNIIEVTACGFTVLNTVCDQGPTNMGALKILRESSGPYEDSSDHYFKIDGKPIYIIYDIPHLFKSLRNNFLNAGRIVMDAKIGKWENLLEVETHNRNFLYLSKISQLHVYPKYRAKMRVKLAAQLLSNTVAAVLKLLARGEPEDKANEFLNTADVIEALDRLFDITNGPSGPKDIKKKIRENVSINSNHMEKWTEFIRKLNNTRFVNRQGVTCTNVKCINGYIISLKSLRDIWLTVKGFGYKYLNLRNLNQDALENLFGLIRQHSPTNRNPIVAHFTAALKTSIITGLTAPHSRGSNCEKDDKILLTNFHNFVLGNENANETHQAFVEGGQNIEVEPTTTATTTSAISDTGHSIEFPVLELAEVEEEEIIENNFSLLNEQAVVYVAGYIAKQLIKHSNCLLCKNNLIVSNPGDNEMYKYIFLREWWQDQFKLIYPSLNFCNVIKKKIDTTENELIQRLHERNICLLFFTLFYIKDNQDLCFTCPAHGHDVAKICFQKTSKLLIRRQCQRVNQAFANKEEDVANINKKAEQQGRAK